MNEDKAARYHRLNRRGLLLWTVPSLLAATWWIREGGSCQLRDLAGAATGGGPSDLLTVAVYTLALTLAYQALLLPLVLYQGFVLERRYGLGAARFSTWLLDFAKAAAVLAIPAVCSAVLVYAPMAWWPHGWWIASSMCLISASLVLARITPVVLLPLFYRFEPLERESLRNRLVALCQRARVPVLGVYVWALGEKSHRANAALTGTGSTRRILLSDTLLADYSDEEIEVILAHEIGHYVHADIRTALVLEALLITITLAIGALALESSWLELGLVGPSDVAGLPLLLGIGALLSLAARPLLKALSRWNERRADDFALTLTGQPAAFVSAMRRLAAQNLAEERPSRTALWFFHTHPPLEQRLESARQFQSRSDPEVRAQL